MKSKRVLFIFALVLALAMAFSVFSIFFEIGHTCCCEKEFCQICALLTSHGKDDALLNTSLFSSFAFFAFLCIILPLIFIIITKPTPIKLKVKLSN